MEDILIEFQIYLNDKKLITNHDWDFEKMARKFIKGRKIVSKNFIKPAVISSLPCDHEHRSGFNEREGSFIWCAKCKERIKQGNDL